jgi:hypothetical protein
MGHTQRLTEAKVVAAPLAVTRFADEIVASIFEKTLAIRLESRTLTAPPCTMRFCPSSSAGRFE